jgi:rhamnogalacturonyl hydrolase YesR
MNPPISIALANTILARYPDPDDIPYRSWCYLQGYVLDGFEKLWAYTGERRYLDYVLQFADRHVTAAGAIPAFTGESLDDMRSGTTILAAYEHTGERRYRLAAERIRAAFADYPRNQDGGFWHARSLPGEMWIDGLFMGGMYLLRYGSLVGDRAACFDEVTHQILCLAGHCRKGNSGLFLHAYDETRHAAWAGPESGLSPEVWSEGLGWYALLLVETLAVLPATHPAYPQVHGILTELLGGLRRTQDGAIGLWYQVVDRGERPDNWHDTSGSAMFVYSVQRAIDLGLAGPAEYGPVVARGYAGLLAKAVITPAGLVDIHDACDGVCVLRSYEDYVTYPRSVNAKEAVGGVLWAASIVEKPAHS